ncbi:MAG: PD-(D/E)XK nuclease family protein [Calothrix sp. C42_A2020_038]|nr:PD-(D/E)XK nuclease family protein [Calothrix sp. C42_A2020_038]
MMFDETHLMRLSQGQINTLEKCPRQFQHTYIEQLYSPTDPERDQRLMLGSRFHLLMQQRAMGLSIDSFLEADAQLRSWVDGINSMAPSILKASNNETRESEHYRTLQFQNYLLTVVYDLLIADSVQAQIIDWKTYPKPQNPRYLEQNWQTRLYLFVLAQTSQYIPENISMTYWFVQPEDKPQNIKFNYTTVQHEQTKNKLNELLTQLTQYISEYYQGKNFPQVREGSKICEKCQFATRCHRNYAVFNNNSESSPSLAVESSLLNLVTIEEVTL